MIRINFIFFCFLFTIGNAYFVSAQEKVVLTGAVIDELGTNPVQNLMVVSKRTQQGYFSGFDGRFKVSVDLNDTIIIAATGYSTLKIAVADSIAKGVYDLRISMPRLQVNLKPVEIFTKRDLDEIEREIQTLGFDESDYMLDGIDAISSPITALYLAFSKRERSKRLVAEMRNNDKRRSLLKELFRKYVDYEIIDLENEEFDRFIDFCRVSDDFLKSSTQYDFIMYVKKRFEVFRMLEN
ncbi:MAG: hypothetical protein ACK5C5_09930 [Bacteroidota bacterium]|jgi:hypothetical protein